jgi:hypothetical protein
LIEIINNIIVKDNVLMLHSKRRFDKNQRLTAKSSQSPLLRILLTCRALYFAGVEAFYKRNTFRFQHSEHLRKCISGLGYDQRWWIHEIELNVEWVNSRRGGKWSPLHEMDYCAGWTDAIDCLPSLRTVAIRSITKYGQAQMLMEADVSVFEQRMRAEMGEERQALLKFVWPAKGRT